MKPRHALAVAAATLGGLAATAPAALAVDPTTTVAGTVGSELTIAVSSPAAAMTLTHATPATASVALAVTSTNANWTAKIYDATTGVTGHPTGRMEKCTTSVVGGVTSFLLPTTSTSPLSQALQYETTTAGTFAAVPAQASAGIVKAVTGTGLGITNFTVNLKQSLASSDAVAATDPYCVTLGFNVS